MPEGKLISLMLYATALSTEMGGVSYREVGVLADAINGTPPDGSDMKRTMQWLERNGYISSRWWKYRLTETGSEIFSSASRETKEMPVIWQNLERIMNDRILYHTNP